MLSVNKEAANGMHASLLTDSSDSLLAKASPPPQVCPCLAMHSYHVVAASVAAAAADDILTAFD